jgi:zinc transporter ZupT
VRGNTREAARAGRASQALGRRSQVASTNLACRRSIAEAAEQSEQASPAKKDEKLVATGISMAELPDLLANAEAAAGSEHEEEGRASQAATMIWLGILIDAVPESVVMGILVNTAAQGQLLAFVVGVFLANFPEAMSSAGTMRLHGMRRRGILLMWISIMLMTGVGAFLGAMIFKPGSTEDPVMEKVIAGIEGLCGGAMLCMIANTVLPEAFEQGGDVTGMSCLMGFLVAIAVSVAA